MTDRKTLDTYNRYAAVYDQEVVEFWQQFPKSFIDDFAAASPGQRVLDVGSGSGQDALLLRDRKLEVTCVDGSTSMIDITKALGFTSVLADFEHMQFAPKSFDAMWAYTSLIHVPKEEAQAAIIRLRPSLVSKGIFAIGVIEGTTAEVKERETMPGGSRYFKNYTSDELKDMIEPLGFTFLNEGTYQPHNSVYLHQLYRLSEPDHSL